MGRSEALRKFNKKWIEEDWAKGWLVDVTNQQEIFQDAYCKLCKVYIRAHKSDLLRHSKSASHTKNLQVINIRKQNQITHHIRVTTDNDKKRDIIIAAHIAMHSSVRSVDHLGEIMNALKITSSDNSIKQHRTKCTSIIKNVIGPSLIEDLLEDVKDKPYSLIVDESTDISVKKYLCLCIRYFSVKKNNIVVDFLGFIEVEKTTAEDLYKCVKSFLVENNLDINWNRNRWGIQFMWKAKFSLYYAKG